MKNSRHRYIAFRTSRFPSVGDNESLLVEAILSKLRERPRADGPIGFRFRVIEYNATTCKGIVRVVPHTAVERMKKLISSFNQNHGDPLDMNILGVSGTLRATRRKYMNHREQGANQK
jgi:RNase P/RNase MRP subunit POP5